MSDWEGRNTTGVAHLHLKHAFPLCNAGPALRLGPDADSSAIRSGADKNSQRERRADYAELFGH